MYMTEYPKTIFGIQNCYYCGFHLFWRQMHNSTKPDIYCFLLESTATFIFTVIYKNICKMGILVCAAYTFFYVCIFSLVMLSQFGYTCLFL